MVKPFGFFLFSLFFFFFQNNLLGQCGGGNPATVNANPDCSNASLITTNGTYTGSTANFPAVPSGGHWLDGISSGLTVENIGYYKFVADSNVINFIVCSGTCGYYGTQIYIFKTCGDKSSKVLTVKQICNGCGSITLSNGTGYTSSYTNNGSGCYTIRLSGLTVGDTYYWGVDGYQGSQCNYSIQFPNGIQTNTNPITPTFAAIGPYCIGDVPSALPTSSNNTPPITGTWSPATINTAANGSTIYKFTPNAGQCADSTNITVVVNQKPNITVNSPTICSGQTATLTANGGSTYTWSSGLGSGNPKSVSPANTSSYTVTGTDANGCKNTATSTVTISSSIKPTFNAIAPFCNGNAAPSLPSTSLENIAGTWNPSVVNNTASATYKFTPNAGQCADTASITIVVNQKPNITVNSPTICSGQTATLTANGGSTYTWSSGLGSGNPKSVSPVNTSSYTVTGTDANGCKNTATSTVTISSGIKPTFTNPGPICTNSSLSLATTSNEGVNGAWSPAANNTTTTTYTFTPNAGQCADTASITVVVSSSITPTFTPVAEICAGEILNPLPTTSNNGIAGTWSPALDNTQTITYAFTPNAGQCSNANTTMKITVNSLPNAAVSTTNNFCLANNGTATVLANGGTPNYSYAWNVGGSAGNSISNLSANQYTVTVTDSKNCSVVANGIVKDSSALINIALNNITNASCNGASDGAIDVSITGGSTPYSFSWNSSPIQQTEDAAALAAGNYILTVTDKNGCTNAANYTVAGATTITFQAPVTVDVSCFGGTNGSATVNAQNGTGGYQYVWSDALAQTSNPATNLAAGNYSVTVTDQNNCTAQTSVSIQEPSALTVALSGLNISCFGAADGSIAATANGGVSGNPSAYTYQWNNTAQTDSIKSLGAGNYTVTATDAAGCTATGSYEVLEPAAIALIITNSRTKCASSSDGIINSSSSGGTGTITLSLIQNGIVLQTNTSGGFSGVAAGNYTIEAKDQNGCIVTQNTTVESAKFNTYALQIDSTSCFGNQYNDGHLFIDGKTVDNAPFQYAIDGGKLDSSKHFYNLAAGNHTVNVKDNFGCDTTFVIFIPQPLPATLLIEPGDTTLQQGNSVQLTSVFSPYASNNISKYEWTPSNGLNCADCANPIATPTLPQSNYHLTVIYNNGCVAESDITITLKDKESLYIPNTFSPNSDGNNDVFLILGEGIKSITLKVFNRWGELVFESSNKQIGWDGNYKGIAQPHGEYVYVAEVFFLNKNTTRKSGSFTLIR